MKKPQKPDMLDFWARDSKNPHDKGYVVPLRNHKGKVVGYGYPNITKSDVKEYKRQARTASVKKPHDVIGFW